MPESILDHFAILESFQSDGAKLRLRFVPGFFDVEESAPVLTVEIEALVQPGKVGRKVASIENDTVYDIQADLEVVQIWVECEEAAVTFQGKVTWRQEDYGISDYIAAIKSRDRLASELHDQILQLRKTLNRVSGFVDRALDRAERKQAADAHGDNRFAKEVQLLRSIRRQLSDD